MLRIIKRALGPLDYYIIDAESSCPRTCQRDSASISREVVNAMMKPQHQSPRNRIEEIQKEDLIRQYIPLVRRTMRDITKGVKPGVDTVELFENGVLALVEALKTYQYEDSMPFSEYAGRFVREAMMESLRRATRPERPVEILPFAQIEEDSDWMDQIEAEEPAPPSGKAADVIAFDGRDPLTSLLSDESTRLIAIALNRLPHAERVVLQMTFYDNLSPSQMAKKLDISIEEISALRNAGLRRLRKRLLMHH